MVLRRILVEVVVFVSISKTDKSSVIDVVSAFVVCIWDGELASEVSRLHDGPRQSEIWTGKNASMPNHRFYLQISWSIFTSRDLFESECVWLWVTGAASTQIIPLHEICIVIFHNLVRNGSNMETTIQPDYLFHLPATAAVHLLLGRCKCRLLRRTGR